MKCKKISFYDNFKCLGSDCPDTCCKGWIIPLNDDDLSLYHSQKGLLLLRLLLAEGKQNNISCLNKNSGVCSFLDKDRLCSLQRQCGEDFLCNTCRVYPRNMSNMGEFLLLTLDLSCPEASRLFIESIDNINYIESDTDIDIPLSITNDDTTFLKRLLAHEAVLCNFIKDEKNTIPVIFGGLIDYATKLQNEYIINPDTTCMDSLPILNVEHEVYFDSIRIDKLLHSKLYHKRLKKTDPELYRLMKIYEKEIADLKISDANEIIANLIPGLSEYYKEIAKLIKAYLCYLIKDTYLLVYEDYSFRKCIISAIMHTQLVTLFLYLKAISKNSLPKADIAEVISAYDKRARHNSQISDEMYAVLSDL